MKQAAKIGSCTRLYMERMIDSRTIKEQAYQGCTGILRLAAAHTPPRVEAACKLALQSTSNTYRTIANILLNNRDLLLEGHVPFKLPAHDNLRGSEAYS
jgi:hypothetical protein